jgi:ribonucleotide reductase alpha subunit
LEVLSARYLRRNEAGELAETPDGMFARVARAVTEPATLFVGFGKRASWSGCVI